MKVFVAGATGALGKQLVPMLVANGHDVVGMTRTEAKRDQLRSAGAQPVVADALDANAVGRAVGEAEPDVIVHQLTAIPPAVNMRHFEREFALTNRLRTEGTDHLLSAGQAVGVKRFVAQSNAAVPYARIGGPIKREDDPLDDDPPPAFRQGLAAIRHLEAAVTGAHWTDGLVLRYGWFYGPGTSIALDPLGSQIELLRKRQLPSSAGAQASGRSSTSRTPPRQPSPPSRADRPASTTSSTTNRHPSPNGRRRWRPPAVRSDRCGCRAGSGGSRQASTPSWR
jgi:nucleoside-diphosphate-sugar epimerase